MPMNPRPLTFWDFRAIYYLEDLDFWTIANQVTKLFFNRRLPHGTFDVAKRSITEYFNPPIPIYFFFLKQLTHFGTGK